MWVVTISGKWSEGYTGFPRISTAQFLFCKFKTSPKQNVIQRIKFRDPINVAKLISSQTWNYWTPLKDHSARGAYVPKAKMMPLVIPQHSFSYWPTLILANVSANFEDEKMVMA